MTRSLRVRRDCIDQVKRALPMQGYARQADLASDLALSLTTVNKFLTGKPVDHYNFLEICQRLNQDVAAIAAFDDADLNENVPKDGLINHPSEDSDVAIEASSLRQFYVERPPLENTCYGALQQPGALVRIKAPSHMGKTSLLKYVLLQLQEQGYQKALVNFHMVEAKYLESLDAFLRWFCISVSQRLQRPNRLEDLWSSQFSTAKENCTQYFESYLLPEWDRPLVLCLDQVDYILTYPQAEIVREFLSLLRAWHELAKINARWTAMRLVILHSTEVYLQLGMNESPFNVGQAIELTEFTAGQARQLAENHQVDLQDEQLRQLLDMVGGHPYLLKQAFFYIMNHGRGAFQTLLDLAPTEAGIYRNHLRQHWTALQKNAELADTLKYIVNTDRAPVRVDPSQAYQLYSRGLVKFQGNQVVIRCQLYQEYFASQL